MLNTENVLKIKTILMMKSTGVNTSIHHINITFIAVNANISLNYCSITDSKSCVVTSHCCENKLYVYRYFYRDIKSNLYRRKCRKSSQSTDEDMGQG